MTLSKEQIKRLGELHKEIANIYLESLNEEDKEVTPKEKTTEKSQEVVEDKAVEKEDNEAVNLEKLSYNELKKMAKDLGLSAKGTKAELVIRIQEAQGIVTPTDDEEDTEEPQVEEPTTETEELEETEDEVEEEEEELPTTLHEEVMEQLEEYTDEELKEVLESINKPTKGKRQTLIALIVQAIEDGEIDFGDEEESEEEDEDTTESTETKEVEEAELGDEEEEGIDLEEVLEPLDRDEVKAICRKLGIKVLKKDTVESLRDKVTNFEDTNLLMETLIELGIVAFDEEELEEDEEDEIEVIEPNYTGSKARIKAMKKIYTNTLEELEEGDITPKQVKTLLDKYHNGTWKGTKEENNLEYARIIAELVDDDGDQVDLEEAYYVGDDVYCCGAELKDVDGDFYCEHCGTTYSDDE